MRCVYDKCRLINGLSTLIVFSTLFTSAGELSINRGAFWLAHIFEYNRKLHGAASGEKRAKLFHDSNTCFVIGIDVFDYFFPNFFQLVEN